MKKHSKIKAVIASAMAAAMMVSCIPAVAAASPAPAITAIEAASSVDFPALLMRTPLLQYEIWAYRDASQTENRGFGKYVRINYDQTVQKIAYGVYAYTDGNAEVHIFRTDAETGRITDERGWEMTDYGDDLYWIRPGDNSSIYFENGRLHHIYTSKYDSYTGAIPNIYVDYNEQGQISAIRYVVQGDTTYTTMNLEYTTLDNGMSVCTAIRSASDTTYLLYSNSTGELVAYAS